MIMWSKMPDILGFSTICTLVARTSADVDSHRTRVATQCCLHQGHILCQISLPMATALRGGTA
jgi:hypothetical protein